MSVGIFSFVGWYPRECVCGLDDDVRLINYDSKICFFLVVHLFCFVAGAHICVYHSDCSTAISDDDLHLWSGKRNRYRERHEIKISKTIMEAKS